MSFIGQERILREIALITDDINAGNNHNILFRAQSGYGKTHLGLSILLFLGSERGTYYLPSSDGVELNPPFMEDKLIHLVDEVHTYKNQEQLYPLMDSGRFSFILMSNETGQLREPLINRCIQFNFEPYTAENINQIVELKLNKYNLDRLLIEQIGSKCSTPREVKILCERLMIIFNNYLLPDSPQELERILEEIMGISQEGLTTLELDYLNLLTRLGGQASLNTLSYGLRLDKATIMRDVEPKLIYLNKITISSRGRQLIGEN